MNFIQLKVFFSFFSPASSFSCPSFFTLSTWFFFLPISTYHLFPPLRTHARLYTLYGPVTICNYHKCFIFSMHRLKLDCCMLAHFSMQQLVNFNSKPVTFVTKFLFLKAVLFVAWQFLELQVSYLSSGFSVYLVFVLFFSPSSSSSEVSLSNPLKLLCAKFGKQISPNSLTQLEFRSVVLIYPAVKGRLLTKWPTFHAASVVLLGLTMWLGVENSHQFNLRVYHAALTSHIELFRDRPADHF